MQFLIVVIAALAAYAFGAVWYMSMSKAWAEAAGLELDDRGRPKGAGGATPFVVGFVAELLVAGMMRHIFVEAHLNTVVLGVMGGGGIGLFLITPWVAMNYAFAGRPYRLTLIDGVNSVVGCTLMGIVFGLFAV